MNHWLNKTTVLVHPKSQRVDQFHQSLTTSLIPPAPFGYNSFGTTQDYTLRLVLEADFTCALEGYEDCLEIARRRMVREVYGDLQVQLDSLAHHASMPVTGSSAWTSFGRSRLQWSSGNVRPALHLHQGTA